MKKRLDLNIEQRKVLSSFFTSLAVGWFSAIFIVQNLDPHLSVLTLIRYIGSMVLALVLAVLLAA